MRSTTIGVCSQLVFRLCCNLFETFAIGHIEFNRLADRFIDLTRLLILLWKFSIFFRISSSRKVVPANHIAVNPAPPLTLSIPQVRSTDTSSSGVLSVPPILHTQAFVFNNRPFLLLSPSRPSRPRPNFRPEESSWYTPTQLHPWLNAHS